MGGGGGGGGGFQSFGCSKTQQGGVHHRLVHIKDALPAAINNAVAKVHGRCESASCVV